jgi:ribosome-associated toxin RatA of RatAB toxin-antitoxin module
MNHVYRESLVPYTPQQMFDLVHHINNYPRFLPWCKAAHVKEQTGNTVIATLLLSKGGLQKAFTTKNTFKAPERIDIDLVNGPFKHLTGHWRFEARPEGCLVVVDLEFEFSSHLLEILIGPVFNEIAQRLIHAFTEEAHHHYGSATH